MSAVLALSSRSPRRCRALRRIHTIMKVTKPTAMRPTIVSSPSCSLYGSERLSDLEQDADGEADRDRERDPGPHPAERVAAALPHEKRSDDPDDQRGLDALAQADYEGRQHLRAECKGSLTPGASATLLGAAVLHSHDPVGPRGDLLVVGDDHHRRAALGRDRPQKVRRSPRPSSSRGSRSARRRGAASGRSPSAGRSRRAAALRRRAARAGGSHVRRGRPTRAARQRACDGPRRASAAARARPRRSAPR